MLVVLISFNASAQQEGSVDAPLPPRPFQPVTEPSAAPTYESYESTTVTYEETIPAAPKPESSSPSRFQLDGTEKGSVASKDTQTYNANSTRTVTKTTRQETKVENKPKKPFRAHVEERDPRTGWSVGIYGGVNVSSSTEGTLSTAGLALPPGSSPTISIGSGSDVGFTTGLKGRYTWPFDEEPIDQFQDEVGGEGLRISGALEGEFGYVTSNIDAGTGGSSVDIEMDSFIFMVNAYLVLQAEQWRPYLGVGGGGVAVMASGSAGLGDGDTVALAYQAIAGVDYFFKSDWSIFAEYKFLTYDGLSSLYSSVDIDTVENHLLLLGIRKHY